MTTSYNLLETKNSGGKRDKGQQGKKVKHIFLLRRRLLRILDRISII